MNPATFLSTSRLVIVAGKGGAGKTTVSAAMAVAAGSEGLAALVVEVDDHGDLGRRFDRVGPLGAREVTLVPATARSAEIRGRAILADRALRTYLDGHGLGAVTRRLASGGALELVTSAVPGLGDLLVLGQIRQLVDQDPADIVIVDAPATGHAMTFLSSPAGLARTVSSGPVHDQAELVAAMLTDPKRCQVVLVALPEETPVNEAIEAAEALSELGVSLGMVVANGCTPTDAELADAIEAASVESGLAPPDIEGLLAAGTYAYGRQVDEADQRARLGAGVGAAVAQLPRLAVDDIGARETALLARTLLG